MGELKYAESFRDLLAYQKARELQCEIFLISQTFPRDEKFSLTDQLRRSSRSIGANIAEAWGSDVLKHTLSANLLILTVSSMKPNIGSKPRLTVNIWIH